MNRQRARNLQRDERGMESVELAIALPILLLVLFAGFEYGWAVLKSIQVDHAARVGAREAALSGASAGDVADRVQAVLADSGISGATVTLTPVDPASVGAGTPIVVEIVAPYSDIQLLGLGRIMPLPSSIRGRASMVKEPDA